jgi:hypothetical protein
VYKGLPSGALALKADMRELLRYVCFVPILLQKSPKKKAAVGAEL